MTFRTRLLGCMTICLLAMAGCEPGPDNPGAGANNLADAGSDSGGPDTTEPDSGDPDAMEPFSFDGIQSLTPGVVETDAPAEVALELATTGELPEDAEVLLEVDGEPVDLADDMTFSPPSRPGTPGVVRVAVTIGETTHQTSLRFAIDPTTLELDDDQEALELPGTERAAAVWTVDSDGDGDIEYLVHDTGGGADESMDMLRVYEAGDDGALEQTGEVALPGDAEVLDQPQPIHINRDGKPDVLSVTVLAPADSADTGERVLQTRLHKGRISQLEEVHAFSSTEVVVDAMVRDKLDPDAGGFIPDMTAIVVETTGDNQAHWVRKKPGRAVTYDPLGLDEYDPANLLDGTEPLGLCPDEAILGAYPTGAIVGMDVNPDTGQAEVLYAPATSHNASRSNRSQGIAAPNGGGDCDDQDRDIKPGLSARITDVNGDQVGDLVVAVGCPGDVDVHVAAGSDAQTASGTQRRYGGAMKLLEDQATTSVIHTLDLRTDGVLTGMATGRCEADRCEAPFAFEVPAEEIGRGMVDRVDIEAIPSGNPLHEESDVGGQSVLYEGLAGPQGGGDLTSSAHEVLSAPIKDDRGAIWVPAGGRLMRTIAPLSDPSSLTHLAELTDAHEVDVAETPAATTVLASVRGPVQLRNADQAKRDGGALMQTTPPRVLVARCKTSSDEQTASARSWHNQRCANGFELEELTPPDECIWNGQVSLHRASDGSYVDARVGIARERNEKKQIRRFRANAALSDGDDLGTVEFPEAPGAVVAIGNRVFSIDDGGEVLTGELMGGGALLNEVRLESTGIQAAIRTQLGDGGHHRRILPVRIQSAVRDYGLAVTAESRESGPFVLLWNPSAEDEQPGWWGHCEGWSDSVSDSTPNARVETVVSSYDAAAGKIVDDLLIARPGERASGDETLRVRPFEQGRLLDACGEPTLGGAWPDEHICPDTTERCRGGILASGDLDGDGYGDIALATQAGPVLYSNITAAQARRVGPLGWMAPEHAHRWTGPSGGQFIGGEDGRVSVAPPSLTFLDGVLSPYIP